MEAVKIKQATKAGFAIWRVGGWQIYHSRLPKREEEEFKGMERYAKH